MKKHYTIFIGSEDSLRQKQISPKIVNLFLLSASSLLVLLFAFLLDYFFAFSGRPALERYEVENKALKIQLTEVQGKMKKMTARMQSIEDFSKKIRFIAGLEPSGPSLMAVGPLSRTKSAVPQALPEALPVSQALPVGSLDPAPALSSRFMVYMDQWDQKSQLLLQDVNLLLESLYEKQDILHSTPSLKPARGWISSVFGYRQLNGDVSMHEGIDIAAVPGAPVYAPADGTVVFAGYKAGYGKMITIDHGYQLSTLYGHLSDIMVSRWQKIKRGDVIAATGNTGHSSGPHLHYEVRIAHVPVDPANYILTEL